MTRLELQRLVRHPVLRGAARGIGAGVRHRPDALARVGVHDPAVIEFVVERQLADRVDLDFRRPGDLETFARRAVAIRHDGHDGGRRERALRGLQLVMGSAAAGARDGDPELPEQTRFDVGTTVPRAAAETHDVAKVLDVAVERGEG